MNAAIGRAAAWTIVIAIIISSGNAISRHFFSISSNAWLELQWYLLAQPFFYVRRGHSR